MPVSWVDLWGGKSISDWGNYVYVKINASELFAQEITKIPQRGEGKELFFSSVTDPYQGLEAKYCLTRKCIETIANTDYRGYVSILTKSDLVTRDIDLFKRIKNIAIGLTITSDDDGISQFFEKNAPPVSQRFKALEILNKKKIDTYAFIGPLLPHFVANQKSLENIFIKLKKIGTTKIFVEHLNLSTYIKNRLVENMNNSNKNIIEEFYLSQSKEYRDQLDKVINKLIKKHSFTLIRGTTIFHKEHLLNQSK